MIPREQAEQAARKWLNKCDGVQAYHPFAIPALAALLLTQRAAVLDDVAIPIVDAKRIGFAHDDVTLSTIIAELRQQAKEARG